MKLNLILLILSVLIFAGCSKTKGPESGVLFNGENLDGWKVVLKEPAENVWFAKEGNLYTTGNPWGYIETEKSFKSYKLHVEWRWIPGLPITARRHNSGVFVHIQGDPEPTEWPDCFEAQLATGMAGAVICMGTTSCNELKAKLEAGGKGRSIPRKPEVSENPLGEWNSYDITCEGDTITLYVNGVHANTVTGLSQVGGRIALQSEGAAVEFRNVMLEPLD